MYRMIPLKPKQSKELLAEKYEICKHLILQRSLQNANQHIGLRQQSKRAFFLNFFRCEIWVAVLFKPIKSKFEDNNKKTHTIHESIRLKCDLNSILYRKICVMLHVILLQFVLKQMFWAINSMQSLNSIYE